MQGKKKVESKNMETIDARQEERGEHERGDHKCKARREGRTRT
jgi:hypothetical protein